MIDFSTYLLSENPHIIAKEIEITAFSIGLIFLCKIFLTKIFMKKMIVMNLQNNCTKLDKNLQEILKNELKNTFFFTKIFLLI